MTKINLIHINCIFLQLITFKQIR